MFASLLILLVLPFTDFSRVKGPENKPAVKFSFWAFVGTFLILIFVGAQHPESPFVELGQFATFLYFSWFLLIMPVLSILENTLVDLGLKNV